MSEPIKIRKGAVKTLTVSLYYFDPFPLHSRCIEMIRDPSQNPIVFNVSPHNRSGTLESGIIRPLMKLGGISNHKSSLVTKITLATIVKNKKSVSP